MHIMLREGTLAKNVKTLLHLISAATVAQGWEEMREAARNLGCQLQEPFMVLSFLALPVIPELKITDRGLVDVTKFTHVPLFV